MVWVAVLAGCREQQPEYRLIGPVANARGVLIEEFSGARCPNCPQGSEELDNLKAIFGSSLVIVAVHAGDFAFTYPDSKFDFTTPEGNALLGLLGNPIGYPSAVINRKRGDSDRSFQQFSLRWGSSISQELEEDPMFDIRSDVTFDDQNRRLQATVSVVPSIAVNEGLRINVLLKEDHIIDPQADRAVPTGIVKEYNHKNVFRAMLSEVMGDPLGDRFEPFTSYVRTYSFNIPSAEGWWKVPDIYLVAFVTSSVTGEVLHAVEVPVMSN